MTDVRSPKPATEATIRAQRQAAETVRWADRRDFELAERGLIARREGGAVLGVFGQPVWDFDAYGKPGGEAPETVNPSLWRQAELNAMHGLYEVVEGIYQVRGFDISNLTLVRGATGWILIDPLTSAETARAAFEFAQEHLGERPVTAVIYTHSHADHFAGIRGVVTDEQVAAGEVRVIGPEGFLEHAVRENVIAGNVMARRATYMYGLLLPKGAQGHVDTGLGKCLAVGSWGLLAPTETVATTGTELTVDGVRIVFQVTPGTEAPAEMNFLFPDHRALCLAENCTATLHNLYTPRGAEIRDALAWSGYIDEALEQWVPRAEVVFASHHWPRWGAEEIEGYLVAQRDTYRYIHDQTMRLANHGLTPREIAEQLKLPGSLAEQFHCRDYYGTVNHNAKAVYQKYLGWFDANPAHLHPLPPVESARRYVEYAGGAEALLARARRDFAAGEYRWVAEVVNHLVFAEPANEEARLLQADALEQLGYQAESGPWRDFYLTGAQELRRGSPQAPGFGTPLQPDVLRGMGSAMLLDYLAVRVDGPRAAGERVRLELRFTDTGTAHLVELSNGTLHHTPRIIGVTDAVVELTRPALARLCQEAGALEELTASGDVSVEGSAESFRNLLDLLDRFDLFFPIVEP